MFTAENVIHGVVDAVHREFPECEIYTEEVEQGLAPPCFSVICGESAFERVLGKRFFRRFDFCVYFYPHSNEVFAETADVRDRTLAALELINVDGDLVRGSDFSSKVVDGVLVICASFGTFVLDDEKAPVMEDITLRGFPAARGL